MSLFKAVFENHGIEHWNWTPLGTPLSLDFYKTWIENGHHGDMTYLKDHLPAKKNPQLLLPKAQSAFVFTFNYGLKKNTLPIPHLKVAAYAQDHDYHYWLKDKIQAVSKDLGALFPQQHFLGFTDSSPVLERDLAYRAGLGWFGKNTCLIDRKRGSLFFIGEIYSTLPYGGQTLPQTVPDHCGTCDRCITACPTQAIESDRTLNATKCISYWTIESKKIPPVELRENFSGWFFGCDICQTVCPWNIKVRDLAQPAARENKPLSSEELQKDLRLILGNSNKQLLRIFNGTPLVRAGGRGLKRNALIVIANLQISSLESLVKSYLNDPELGALASWTLQKIATDTPVEKPNS